MKVVVLSGGVGGARLLDGLAVVMPADDLTAVVNTGDDFTHWGLRICPDLDTVMYTLSGLGDEARGWGLSDESFNALSMVERYGGSTWFALGDRDLATHILRTEGLRISETLTEVTGRLCARLGVKTTLLPMSDNECPTLIETTENGALIFQDWFVKLGCKPKIDRIRYLGPPDASPAVLDALDACDAVIIAPSNPYVSIDPILALDGVAQRVYDKPVVAVSPIVRGRAVKGPLAQMIPNLALREPSAQAIAAHYRRLDGIVIETGDTVDGVVSHATSTIMGGREDRARLAEEVLDFVDRVVRARI